MEQLKLVIFDMDGLLFDTEWPSYLALKEVMEKEGYEPTGWFLEETLPFSLLKGSV